jgi:RNA polymerase sigma-70 factor (ECF subfamily)
VGQVADGYRSLTMTNEPIHLDFVQWFVPNQRRIYGFILTLVPNSNEADEIFQETSLILWKKASEFDPQRDFVRWACGIAVNVIRGRRAKQSRDRHVFGETLVEKIAEVRANNQSWLDERVTALAQCLARLSQRERSLLELFYGSECSVAEIATSESVSANALRQSMHRIRRRLYNCVTHAARQEEAR